MDKKKEAAKKRTNTRHRWKDVERKVAAELSTIYSDVGKSKVERIPLLGREGPDLTINEVGLVINVKSRMVIPARLFPKSFQLLPIGDLVCFRIEDLALASKYEPSTPVECWKQLADWYWFMDKWTKEFKPDGISAIFLHRPRMPIGHTAIVIHINDLKRFTCNLQTKCN